MAFTKRRERDRSRAAAVRPTGMSAVLGGDPAEVAARLAELDLTPANANAGGVALAAGTLEALAALLDQVIQVSRTEAAEQVG